MENNVYASFIVREVLLLTISISTEINDEISFVRLVFIEFQFQRIKVITNKFCGFKSGGINMLGKCLESFV